ncbi:hypothetical protein GMOD_00003603 [Pyrenophora seminiperda CCB06]|uniref:Uncharacterized protein n=1 Tax=Pyrenophora seminiperda CCB06 TaxID=1302712 RepID=A0A3M7MJD9_9PLEO|nr:hypothetical protein GMOD_00003603 [Pyrenophora seminiperda CCB06]
MYTGNKSRLCCVLSHDRPTPHHLHPRAVYAALPNSTLVAASADLQRRSSPDVAIDFEQVTLLVWEADFSLLIKASFLKIICKSKGVLSEIVLLDPVQLKVAKRFPVPTAYNRE